MPAKQTQRGRHCLVIALAVILITMSLKATAHEGESAPRRDINAVLADHDDRLLAISGVAGVSVGVLDDGRTPCLRVMLVRDTPELRKVLPVSIEGYPIVLELTGEIRPLR